MEKGRTRVTQCCRAQCISPSLCWSKPDSGLADGKLELANLARGELVCSETPKVSSTMVPAKLKGPTAPQLVERCMEEQAQGCQLSLSTPSPPTGWQQLERLLTAEAEERYAMQSCRTCISTLH